MAVRILEVTAVHPAVILRIHVRRAAGRKRLVGDVVHLLAAAEGKRVEDLGGLRRVRNLLLREALEKGLGEQHGEYVVADDQAGGVLIRELRIEAEAEPLEEF